MNIYLKKTLIAANVLILFTVLAIIVLVGLVYFGNYGVLSDSYNFAMRIIDPCYSSGPVEKGPAYDIQKNRVCTATSDRARIKTLKGADPKTFKELDVSHGYGMDKNHVYYFGKIIPLNAEKTVVIGKYYLTDGSLIFFNGRQLDGADPQSFIVLDYGVAKDKVAVYWEDDRITDADPDTFRNYPQEAEYSSNDYYLSRDRQHVYLNGGLVKGADPDTFRRVRKDGSFFMDKDNLFDRDELVGPLNELIPKLLK